CAHPRRTSRRRQSAAAPFAASSVLRCHPPFRGHHQTTACHPEPNREVRRRTSIEPSPSTLSISNKSHAEILRASSSDALRMTSHNYADRAARLFGALSACNAARSNFSKLPAPASRLASPTAFSAVRASYPRLTSAETTSASMPAGEVAAGLSDSMATASSLSFNFVSLSTVAYIITTSLHAHTP